MAFEVRITPEAEQDAVEILEWLIAEGAGESGLRWFRRMDEALASLTEMPHRCKLAPENRALPFETRELLYGQRPHVYRLLFTIEGDTLSVLHIRHGRRAYLHR